jgi:hypothetical protein
VLSLFQLTPNDVPVLNRYGRSCWIRAVRLKNRNDMGQKLEYLEDANQILSESINVDDLPSLKLLEDRLNTA